MAQSGRAHGWGPWGRRFESCCPDLNRNPSDRVSAAAWVVTKTASGSFFYGVRGFSLCFGNEEKPDCFLPQFDRYVTEECFYGTGEDDALYGVRGKAD
jgi:hypothetical protein